MPSVRQESVHEVPSSVASLFALAACPSDPSAAAGGLRGAKKKPSQSSRSTENSDRPKPAVKMENDQPFEGMKVQPKRSAKMDSETEIVEVKQAPTPRP